MAGSNAPPAGLIGLTQISGSAGSLIELGQWLNGDGFRRWEHAFVSVGSGLLVEAEPGGARIREVSEYADVYWCRNLYRLGTPRQMAEVEDAAKGYAGVPYSFLDYAALAARRLHLRVPGLRSYIASTKHQICSQLADRCYADAGIPLFADGRWSGYVTPLDLYNLDQSQDPGLK